MIRLENVHVSFRRCIIAGGSLEIPAKGFVAIRGGSGSGKTTLLYELGLIHLGSEDAYFFDGVNVKDMTKVQISLLKKQSIGYVFQEGRLLPHCTVAENLRCYAAVAGISLEEKEIHAVLADVKLTNQREQRVSTLSEGQRIRAAFACALVKNPRLLLVALNLLIGNYCDQYTAKTEKSVDYMSYNQLLAEGDSAGEVYYELPAELGTEGITVFPVYMNGKENQFVFQNISNDGQVYISYKLYQKLGVDLVKNPVLTFRVEEKDVEVTVAGILKRGISFYNNSEFYLALAEPALIQSLKPADTAWYVITTKNFAQLETYYKAHSETKIRSLQKMETLIQMLEDAEHTVDFTKMLAAGLSVVCAVSCFGYALYKRAEDFALLLVNGFSKKSLFGIIALESVGRYGIVFCLLLAAVFLAAPAFQWEFAQLELLFTAFYLLVGMLFLWLLKPIRVFRR